MRGAEEQVPAGVAQLLARERVVAGLTESLFHERVEDTASAPKPSGFSSS